MLMLGLLGLVIITGIIFLVTAVFSTQLCAQVAAGSTYDGSNCVLANGTDFATAPQSITYVEVVVASIVLALGFLAIIVIVAIAKIILRLAKGMGI